MRGRLCNSSFGWPCSESRSHLNRLPPVQRFVLACRRVTVRTGDAWRLGIEPARATIRSFRRGFVPKMLCGCRLRRKITKEHEKRRFDERLRSKTPAGDEKSARSGVFDIDRDLCDASRGGANRERVFLGWSRCSPAAMPSLPAAIPALGQHVTLGEHTENRNGPESLFAAL